MRGHSAVNHVGRSQNESATTPTTMANTNAWVLNAPTVNHWLAVHTGIADMSGRYHAFWSGFGSDIAEFGLVGTAVAGVYQLNRKFNCHQRGCWRTGIPPAARRQ